MLRSLKDLQGYRLLAIDGEIGKVHDFYFDDHFWYTRYLVVSTGKWLPGRLVLISPMSLGQPEWETKDLPVDLTKEQIENSPPIEKAKPISRQMEMQLAKYYQWPMYWTGNGATMPSMPPIEMDKGAKEAEKTKEQKQKERNDYEPNLRSAREVIDYEIEALDGEIGHVEDFVVEDDTWVFRYMVIDTRKWLHFLPGGRKVLVSPEWIERVDWGESKVVVDLTQENIKNSPEFDPKEPINREYEVKLYDFYGRPKYWI